jgi:hypothetical protein
VAERLLAGHTMKRVLLVLFLLAASCSRRERTTVTSAKVDASLEAPTSLLDLADRWNRALSQRDPALLRSVYASSVTLYDAPLRRDQVVRVWTGALAMDPTFTQRVLEARVVRANRIELKRTWTRFGKSYTDVAWLEAKRRSDDTWAVTAEGDEASDARAAARRRKEPIHDSCDAAATRVALSTDVPDAPGDAPPEHLDAAVVAGPPELPAYQVVLTATVRGAPRVIAWYEVASCAMLRASPGDAGTLCGLGRSKGIVRDAFTSAVLNPDPKLLAEMADCPR